MWLFFSLGQSLWIAAALPVSFLASFFVMNLMGMTINMISLVALLMAIGLIMDDSIVIAENVASWAKRVSPSEAAIKGASEVLPGVASSFLTTVCVFGPLMFIEGDIGKVLRVIPIVLLITLSVSLIEAFLILPHHLSHGRPAGRERPAERALSWLREQVVVPVAELALKWRYLTIGCVVAAFLLTIGLITSGTVKVIGFPDVEGDTIEARIATNAGEPHETARRTVQALLAGLDMVDAEFSQHTTDQAPLVEQVLVRYAVNSDVKASDANTATITVDLLESARRKVSADDILAAWRKASGPLPDLAQSNFTKTESGPAGADLDVEILGRDLEEVQAASDRLLRLLLARDDVIEAFQDFTGGKPEIRISLNEFGASLGLSPQQVATQLRNAFTGVETDSFRTGASTTTVRVEISKAVTSVAALQAYPVTTPLGAQISLSTIADLSIESAYPQITRKDGLAVARIEGKIDGAMTTSAQISAVALDEIGPVLLQEFPGVRLQIGGATEGQIETQQSVMSSLLLGLVGVYLVLAFQFRSYSLPVAVMVSIPFALIGTVLGHWALGLNLSMPSFVGFASLAGIVVNNAILFLTFFSSGLKGDDYESAAIDAVRTRLRPILLSSSTTIMGLLPLLFDTSPQVQTMVPLVAAVAFGLLASTVLVTLVFPAILGVYFDVFSVRAWMAKYSGDEPNYQDA